MLTKNYTTSCFSRSASERAKEFPFKKYKSDFTPYAPYKNVYDQGMKIKIPNILLKHIILINVYDISVKYSPNPDWILLKPWGYKFRKARYF